MTLISDFLSNRDRRRAARYAQLTDAQRCTPSGQKQARYLAESGPGARRDESSAAAEDVAYDAEAAFLDEVTRTVGAFTGRCEPLSAEQEKAVLQPNYQAELDEDERLIDAALGATELAADLVHPRWRISA